MTAQDPRTIEHPAETIAALDHATRAIAHLAIAAGAHPAVVQHATTGRAITNTQRWRHRPWNRLVDDLERALMTSGVVAVKYYRCPGQHITAPELLTDNDVRTQVINEMLTMGRAINQMKNTVLMIIYTRILGSEIAPDEIFSFFGYCRRIPSVAKFHILFARLKNAQRRYAKLTNRIYVRANEAQGKHARCTTLLRQVNTHYDAYVERQRLHRPKHDDRTRLQGYIIQLRRALRQYQVSLTTLRSLIAQATPRHILIHCNLIKFFAENDTNPNQGHDRLYADLVILYRRITTAYSHQGRFNDMINDAYKWTEGLNHRLGHLCECFQL